MGFLSAFAGALRRPFARGFWARPPAREASSALVLAGDPRPMGPPKSPPRSAVLTEAEGRAALARRRREDGSVFVPFEPLRVPAWEVEQVKYALEMHERGDFSWSAPMFEAMRRDPAIEPSLKKRLDSLFACDFGFEASDEAPEKLGERIARDARGAWTRVHPEPVLRRLQRWALGVGVVPVQVLSDRNWEYCLDVWDPQWLRFDWSTRSFWILTAQGYVRCDAPRWHVYSPDGAEGWNSGVLRCLAIVWLIHTFAWRDWARFSEVHGLPIRGLKLPVSGVNDEERERFLAEVQQMGRQAVVLLPQVSETFGTSLELIEAKDSGWEGFQKLLETCRLMAQIALLGGNLTSEVRGGSLAAAQEAGGEKRLLIKSDAKSLSTGLREMVWMPRTWARHGRAEYAPWPRWDVDPPGDVKKEGEAAQAVVKAIGMADEEGIDLDASALCERYDLPLREPGKGEPAPKHLAPGRKARRLAKHHLDAGAVSLNEIRADVGLPAYPDARANVPLYLLKAAPSAGDGPDGGGEGEPADDADEPAEGPAEGDGPEGPPADDDDTDEAA